MSRERLFICDVYFWLCWVFAAAQALVQLRRAEVILRGGVRLPIEVASLVAEHGPQGEQASGVVAHELSSHGSRALERRLSSCGSRA